MTDFLGRLAARAQGHAAIVRPHSLATFEPAGEAFQEIWAEREIGAERTETRIVAASPTDRPAPAVAGPVAPRGPTAPAASATGPSDVDPRQAPVSPPLPIDRPAPAPIRAPSAPGSDAIAPVAEIAPVAPPPVVAPTATPAAARSSLPTPAVAGAAPAAVQRRPDLPRATAATEKAVEGGGWEIAELPTAARPAEGGPAEPAGIVAAPAPTGSLLAEIEPPGENGPHPSFPSIPSLTISPGPGEPAEPAEPAAGEAALADSPIVREAAIPRSPPRHSSTPPARTTTGEAGGTVEIRIGRVEIHAAPEPARLPAAAGPGGPSLDAFLARRPR